MVPPPVESDPFLDECLPGTTPRVRELKACIFRLNSQGDEIRSVLITGETGAGKTHIAQLVAMHRCWVSKRFAKNERSSVEKIIDQQRFYVRTQGKNILSESGDPYREVALPVLEGELAQSRLFGHEKGAFTDARKAHAGFLGDSNVTDVLLDEIGYASLAMQRSLLQVIQSGTYYRLGSTKEHTTGARLFFATNQDLQQLIRERKFQEDLWWRLTDHILEVPPLRDRVEEIPIIAKKLVTSLNKQHGKHQGGSLDKSGDLQLTSQDIEWAQGQKWRGNIRELEKTVRRWFFYRGTRTLAEIWKSVAPLVPDPDQTGDLVNVDNASVRAALLAKMKTAQSSKVALASADALVAECLEPARKKTAELLCECLDTLGCSRTELQQIFAVKPESVRSWKSRNRSSS